VQHAVKGYVACIGHYGNAYTASVGKLEESRPHEKACHRWEDIEMGLRMVVWGVMGWCFEAQH
jgi:hypothetical protein